LHDVHIKLGKIIGLCFKANDKG